MLATWFAETHPDNVVVGLGHRIPEGSGSKFVAAPTVAASVPRVGEAIVTLLPLRLTTPVKSSMSSSWLEPRFAFWRGSVKALNTGGLGAAGLKLTDSVPLEMEIAFFKLKSRATPWLPVEVTVSVKEAIMGLALAVSVAV